MSLKRLLRNAVFGFGLALMPGCSTGNNDDNFDNSFDPFSVSGDEDVSLGGGEGEGSVNLEARIFSSTTNRNGIAEFEQGEPITVKNAKSSPLADVGVNLFQIYRNNFHDGDVYLAETPQNEGGIAVFANAVQAAQNVRRQGIFDGEENESDGNGRELTVRPTEGLTIFDHDSEDIVYNLMRWEAGNEYNCLGTFTTEELIEQRGNTFRLFSYLSDSIDPSGASRRALKTAYDVMNFFIDMGWLDDLPPNEEWYVLDPENPLAPTSVIQRDVADRIYDSRTYNQLEEACGGGKEGEAESEGEECFSHASLECSGGDAYWYDSCDAREERADDCLSNETCVSGQCVEDVEECMPHNSRECSNGDVYWYDSCGAREDRYDNCSSSETCEDGRCVEDCSSHASRECSNGDVYWYDSCGVREDRYDDCSSSETCEDGRCVEDLEECVSHASRGCSGGDAYWYDSCGAREERYDDCIAGEHCAEGACVADCTPHASRGCSGGDAYWYDSCGNRQERYDDCSSSERCEDGQCVADCTSHASRGCSSGDAYWYDSCGTREDRYDDCSSSERCEEGECVASCVSHAYRECSLGSGDIDVYWFDSCGWQEEMYDNCSSSEHCEDDQCVPCVSHHHLACSSGDVYWYSNCTVREERYDDCSPSESCEDGRCVTGGTGRPDLVAGSLRASPSNPTVADPVTLSVMVNNAGSVSSPCTYYLARDGTSTFRTGSIPTINAGGSTTVDILLGAEPGGTHTYIFTADANNIVSEENESNNSSSLTLIVRP